MNREERQKAYYDTSFEVWRRGGNPDAVDYDRVNDACYEGRLNYGVDEREVDRCARRPEPQIEQEYEQEQEQPPEDALSALGDHAADATGRDTED